MNGLEFEKICAHILRKMGYENVHITKECGDQGVDVLAEHNEVKYAIQCKYYSEKVGNRAIQEISAGKQFYHCHVGIVMTNNYFTKSAVELAKENGIILWDGDFIRKFANEIKENNKIVSQDEQKGIIKIRGEASKLLFDYIDSMSREAINNFLQTKRENIYENEMIKYAKTPILYYEAKFDPEREKINYKYYCGIKFGFQFSSAYKYIKKLSKDSSRFNIFELGVFYNMSGIFLSKDKVSVNEMPQVHIMPSTIENMKILEGLDDEIHSLKISQDIFAIKAENVSHDYNENLYQSKKDKMQSEIEQINAENEVFDIFDVEERIVRFKDNEISKMLFEYFDNISRRAIDTFLQEKNENEYINEMIECVEQPITFFNAKYHSKLKFIMYIYYCKIGSEFVGTSVYEKLYKNVGQDGKKTNDDLFQISVFYDIDDISLIGENIKIAKQPQVDIESTDMETIESLEVIDDYDQSVKSYINKKSFFLKMDNIKSDV